MKNKILLVLVSLLVISCRVFNKKYTPDRQNTLFMNYLKSRGIDPDTVKVFSRYYDDHFWYKQEQKRQALLKNPYLKINEVYYYSYGDIRLVLFSDDGEMYRNKFNINHHFIEIIGDTLVKIKEPIELWSYASFELRGSKLYTLTKERAPYNEWYQTITYNFRNDSIIADKMYKSDLYYKKKWLATTREAYGIKMVHKPELRIKKRTEKLDDRYEVNTFVITGEFKLK
ncbi:hypothetical protein EQP59_02065 [Ornithobacterium rhinotracheale]|uniref:Uncharacterized protein n=1 Tax=Ornithobacterium rhinotracheale TaxID=28251 RepID=A0A3R5YV06_ORNRH|nr:hypothetical protein [Ornithobacterium rhinotracheale]QAR30225.1 hypothetical protein EQP59_02065 [Ornithobacterium rhinotracheale]